MSLEKLPEKVRDNIVFKQFEDRKVKLLSAIGGTACLSILCLISFNLTTSLENIKHIQFEKFENIAGEIK